MALITFLSDFGTSDHYAASIKAKMLSVDPSLRIVDICHEIKPFDLAHGAYVLSQVFREFPAGTVHLVTLESQRRKGNGYLALEMESHFFVGPNNGVLSMVSPLPPKEIVDLDDEGILPASFPAKRLLAPAAANLALGKEIGSLGKPCANFVRLIGRQVKATKKLIAGNIIRVDHYGNLITNIEKDVFEQLSSGRPYSIIFGRENSTRIHGSYGDTEEGDCFLLFNSQGLLEIGINTGNAGELLGLQEDSPVQIRFVEAED